MPELGRYDDAIAAFEVARNARARRPRSPPAPRRPLRTRPGSTTPRRSSQHQAVLRATSSAHRVVHGAARPVSAHRQAEKAHGDVTTRSGSSPRSRSMSGIDDAVRTARPRAADARCRPLTNDDWLALARHRHRSPALGAVRAGRAAVRRRARAHAAAAAAPRKEARPERLGTRARARGGRVRHPAPAGLPRSRSARAWKVAMRTRDGVLAAGAADRPRRARQAPTTSTSSRSARAPARGSRTERIARLLCPRAGELAQIIELATAPPRDEPAARAGYSSLHPVELEQARAIGGRLRDRGCTRCAPPSTGSPPPSVPPIASACHRRRPRAVCQGARARRRAPDREHYDDLGVGSRVEPRSHLADSQAEQRAARRESGCTEIAGRYTRGMDVFGKLSQYDYGEVHFKLDKATRPAGDRRDPRLAARPRARRLPLHPVRHRRGRAHRRAPPRARHDLQGRARRPRPRRRQERHHPPEAALRSRRAVPRVRQVRRRPGGHYITAEDSGTGLEDMEVIRTRDQARHRRRPRTAARAIRRRSPRSACAAASRPA